MSSASNNASARFCKKSENMRIVGLLRLNGEGSGLEAICKNPSQVIVKIIAAP